MNISNDVGGRSRSQIATLNEEIDSESIRSQIATFRNDDEIKPIHHKDLSKKNNRGHNLKYLPFAFTEQGVAMLSAVLKSDTALKVSIEIMAAFVSLRKLHHQSAGLFQRLDRVEMKQLEADEQFNKIFNALEKKAAIPEQGIFYNGQIFDAYVFAATIIRKAETSIVLIDNYFDETTLSLLAKRNPDVHAMIYTESINQVQETDTLKLSEQYANIEIRKLKNNHDRLLIIDNKELYHLGASLKDLGKKLFAFSRMDVALTRLLEFISEETK